MCWGWDRDASREPKRHDNGAKVGVAVRTPRGGVWGTKSRDATTVKRHRTFSGTSLDPFVALIQVAWVAGVTAGLECPEWWFLCHLMAQDGYDPAATLLFWIHV